jgi:flagellar basal-body rod protein FlgB
MEGANARHRALAANIANASTPGYQRQDVQFHDALASAMTRGPAAVKDLRFAPQADATAGATRADGNTIDIDRESAALAANRLYYDALLAVKQGRGSIVKTAAGIK